MNQDSFLFWVVIVALTVAMVYVLWKTGKKENPK